MDIINEAEQFAVELLLEVGFGNDKPLVLHTDAIIELGDLILQLVRMSRGNFNGIPA